MKRACFRDVILSVSIIFAAGDAGLLLRVRRLNFGQFERLCLIAELTRFARYQVPHAGFLGNMREALMS